MFFDSRKARLKSGREVVLRSSEIEDAPQVNAFVKMILQDATGMVAVPGELPTTDEEHRASIDKFHRTENQVFIGAFCDGQLIGNVDFRPRERQRLRHVGEFGISVLPDWRGQGLGRLLMDALFEWLGTTNIEKVVLRARADNEQALELYRRMGFREQGRAPRDIKLEDGTYVDDVSMYLFLDPAAPEKVE